jgi:hypothetical protein
MLTVGPNDDTCLTYIRLLDDFYIDLVKQLKEEKRLRIYKFAHFLCDHQ